MTVTFAYVGPVIKLAILVSLALPITISAQQVDSHRQAAAAYRRAASQSSGTRKECYVQWANYEDCQAARFSSSSSTSCKQPTCSLGGSAGESTEGRGEGVNTSPTAVNPFPSVENSFDSLRNTILNIMNGSRNVNVYEDIERREEREVRETLESINNARAHSNRDPEAETEEDERARERERAYKAQRAREKAAASIQTSDVCGWKGLTWFGDKDTVPTLEQLRAANGGSNATLSGDGWLILKIHAVNNDGKISGTNNGRPFTGSINAKRQIWLVSGEKNTDYDEIWGQFSEDGRMITGKWINITLNKQSHGVFALEAECKK